MERRRYKHPPIEEALCEFRFRDPDWDPTLPGRLHQVLRDSYPGKPQQQDLMQATWHAPKGQPSNLSFRQGLARVQLVTEDGSRLVSVGVDTLSVHMLRPYQDPSNPEGSGWEEFLPRIRAALTAYWQVATPRGVEQIGVRYINKITVPRGGAPAQNYFRTAPSAVPGLPGPATAFVGRMEYTYDETTRLVLSQATIGDGDEQAAFILDLDVISRFEEPIEQTRALTEVEKLRGVERDAFEAVITDESRKLFDET